MNYYETVYIIHPALQEGRLNDIVNKFHKKLEDVQGEVLYVTNWGKKKLAYPIDKQKYGTYILCQYSINGENIKNISQELELNPNILRYLITKIDESKILEGSNTLDIAINDSDENKTKSKESKDVENNDSSEQVLEEKNDTIPEETAQEDINNETDDESDSSNNEEVKEKPDDEESSQKETENDNDDENTDKKD